MTRNNADFYGITFKTVSGNENGTHRVFAHHPEHGTIGRLDWNAKSTDKPGRVESLWVDPEHRRKGIATGMWQHALKEHKAGTVDSTPKHSEDRSDKGDAFAKAVGGNVPPRLKTSSREGLEPEPFTPRKNMPKRFEPESGI